MSRVPPLSFDLLRVRLICAQTWCTMMFSPGPYIVLALGIAGTLLSLNNTLGVIHAGYLTVLTEPFWGAVAVMGLWSGMYFALLAGLSVAREREAGTLQVLFYGPLTHWEYMCAKFLAHVSAHAAMMVIFLGVCWVLAPLSALQFSLVLAPIAFIGVLAGSALIGSALLVAALTKAVRGMTLSLVGVFLLLVILQAGQGLLTGIVSESGFTGLVILRDTFEILAGITRWISPVAYLMRGTEALLQANFAQALLASGILLWTGLALVTLAGGALRSRGVSP